jgi:osmotically-inducible protein OsmY
MVAVLERSATSVRDDVVREIAADPTFAGFRIAVAEDAGFVTLAGVVDCVARRRDAEEAAYRVAGVTDVVNEIEIRWDYVHGLRDFDLLAEAGHLLRSHYLLRARKIGVALDGGFARLTGRVETVFEREEAARAVASLASLRGVRNDIVVVCERREPSDLRAAIEGALARTLGADARRVEVGVAARTVWLAGTVASRAERAACLAAVARTPGVAEIASRLEIADTDASRVVR